MATFETTTHPLAFAHMEGGVKTVFVMPFSLEYSVLTSGDRIEFDDLGSITVGAVRRYDTLSAMMEREGHANVVPEAESVDSAVESLRQSDGWSADKEAGGVLAFRVRSVKRKS